MDARICCDILIQLADLEEELQLVVMRAKRSKKRTSDLRGLQAEYDDDAQLAAEDGKLARVDFRGQENALKLLETQLVDRRNKLGTISDPKQCLAMEREISNLEGQIDLLETQALKILADAERKQVEADQAKADRKRQQIRGTAEVNENRDVSKKSTAALDEIRREIDRLVDMLPLKEARHWARLQQRLPMATARISSGACSGCCQYLPEQQAIAAGKGHSVVNCPGCARFLIRRSWK